MESEAARSTESVGEQNLSGGGVFQRNHPSSGASGHEHPHGPQTLLIGPRSLPLAQLPYIRAHAPATDHLETFIPAVRLGPGQIQRQAHRPKLPSQCSTRVEEDQDGLAGFELLDSSGHVDSVPVKSSDPSGSRSATPRWIAFPILSVGRQRPFCIRLGFSPQPPLPESSGVLKSFISTGLCDSREFSTTKAHTHFPRFLDQSAYPPPRFLDQSAYPYK